MENKCLNCSIEIPYGREYCDTCEKELDTMIVAQQVSDLPQVGVSSNMNPFDEREHITGGYESNDSIDSMVRNDNRGDSFSYVVIITFLLIVFMIWFYVIR